MRGVALLALVASCAAFRGEGVHVKKLGAGVFELTGPPHRMGAAAREQCGGMYDFTRVSERTTSYASACGPDVPPSSCGYHTNGSLRVTEAVWRVTCDHPTPKAGTATDETCRRSAGCKMFGNCSRSASGTCVPTTDDQCRASTQCASYGACTRLGTFCRIRSDADCARSERCKRDGQCVLGAGGDCVARWR